VSRPLRLPFIFQSNLHTRGTSISAVAKRPRDASCLSVDSFNSTKRRAQYSIISCTLALDLPLRKLNYGLFSSAYSLVYGFLCRKQTCTVTVIHHWTDDRRSGLTGTQLNATRFSSPSQRSQHAIKPGACPTVERSIWTDPLVRAMWIGPPLDALERNTKKTK